jgi:hypothetical protein
MVFADSEITSLRPRRRINPHRTYRVAVTGTGVVVVADARDVLLDGAGDGKAGSDFVSKRNWRNLILARGDRATAPRMAVQGARRGVPRAGPEARLRAPLRSSRSTNRRSFHAGSWEPVSRGPAARREARRSTRIRRRSVGCTHLHPAWAGKGGRSVTNRVPGANERIGPSIPRSYVDSPPRGVRAALADIRRAGCASSP